MTCELTRACLIAGSAIVACVESTAVDDLLTLLATVAAIAVAVGKEWRQLSARSIGAAVGTWAKVDDLLTVGALVASIAGT